MSRSFDSEFTPHQLERLKENTQYIPPKSRYDDNERKVLYQMYLEHLRETRREHELTNEQKQQ